MTTVGRLMDEPTELELRSDTAEAALIGAVAFHADTLTAILERLPGDDFWNPHRGYVWDACRALSIERQPVEPTRVARHLAAQDRWGEGTQTILRTEMTEASPPAYAAAHADTVADLARRRELLRSISRARRIVTSHPGDATEVLAAVRAEFETSTRADDTSSGGALNWDQLLAEFRAAHAPNTEPRRIPTPWPEFDDKLGGLVAGRMYVFGGRPGMGKSTAALNVAAHAAINHAQHVLVVSKEMPTVDVTGRFLARGAEVNLQEISARRVTASSMNRIEGYIDVVGKPSLTVDARPRRLSGIKALARTHKHRRGLDLLVVDYLQLVRTDSPGRTREQEVAQVSMELKALSMELDCAVVVPAQLNRGSTQRADPRPTMSDLRDSGQIEQDADVVTLLHRERNDAGEYVGTITFIVDKNRHGPTGDITLNWHGGYGSIT